VPYTTERSVLQQHVVAAGVNVAIRACRIDCVHETAELADYRTLLVSCYESVLSRYCAAAQLDLHTSTFAGCMVLGGETINVNTPMSGANWHRLCVGDCASARPMTREEFILGHSTARCCTSRLNECFGDTD